MTEEETKIFYNSSAWHNTRKEVLAHDKNECVICKKNGRHRRAEIVHHVKHLRDFPEFALCQYIEENGEQIRQLISVCRDCHENVCHPERMKKLEYKKPLTEEKW